MRGAPPDEVWDDDKQQQQQDDEEEEGGLDPVTMSTLMDFFQNDFFPAADDTSMKAKQNSLSPSSDQLLPYNYC